MGLYCPGVSFGAGSGLFAKADKKPITRHEPRIMSEPEEDIPVAAVAPTEPKKTPWLKIGLGAAAVVALAAIAAGGGGSDKGESKPKEGTITISW
jgi:hypothetical protein